MEKHARERGKCVCGNPREVCHDPAADWYPQRDVCFASMEKAAAERLYTQLHEDKPYHDGTWQSWAKEPSRTHPFHASDGVTIWVAPVDLQPGDKFTTDALASPTPKGGESDSDEA